VTVGAYRVAVRVATPGVTSWLAVAVTVGANRAVMRDATPGVTLVPVTATGSSSVHERYEPEALPV